MHATDAVWAAARILVVDDDCVSAAFLEAMLRAAGYSAIETTTDPAEGLARVASADLDLLVLDLEMPEVSGYDILELAAERLDSPTHIPILVQTADRRWIARHRALDLGASDFLLKPLQVDEVLLRVRNMLRIRRLHAHLLRANDELTSFAYVAAHDLSQPLLALTSVMHVVRANAGEDARVTDALDAADGAMGYMRELIDALLDFRRSGESEAPVKELHLARAVERAIANLADLVGARAAEVRLGPLPIIRARQVDVVRVIQNLVANAITYTPQDRSPVVHIHAERTSDDWLVLVDDNGIGVPHGRERAVFSPLERLGRPRPAVGGIGMGLAICEQLVGRWGGEIWVESRLHGSRFAFTVPAARP